MTVGEIHDAREARAHIRTRRSLTDSIFQQVRAKHPYEVPSVVAVDLASLNPDYRAWISELTDRRV
jgi:periplasmic divalent cation tolerance protein